MTQQLSDFTFKLFLLLQLPVRVTFLYLSN